MANAQWTQLGPGAGGQERAVYVYNNPATSKYDFYVGSDVSGVWRAQSVDPLLLDDATQYDWQYISNNGIVRFINKFVPAKSGSYNKLFVAYRNGIGTIDLGGTTGMTNLWSQEDSWVSDIFVSTMSGNIANIYFITGTTRLKDEPGNFKNNSTTKDLYMATYDISTNAFTINASYELPELGGEQSEYCLHVNDNGTFPTADDNLLIATETGLYNVTHRPTHIVYIFHSLLVCSKIKRKNANKQIAI